MRRALSGKADLRHSGLPIVTGQGFRPMRCWPRSDPLAPSSTLQSAHRHLGARGDGRFRLGTDAGEQLSPRWWWWRPAAVPLRPSVRRSPASKRARRHLGVLFGAAHGGFPRQGRVDRRRRRFWRSDWTLNLEPSARSLTLLHRRDEFRARRIRLSKCVPWWPPTRSSC